MQSIKGTTNGLRRPMKDSHQRLCAACWAPLSADGVAAGIANWGPLARAKDVRVTVPIAYTPVHGLRGGGALGFAPLLLRVPPEARGVVEAGLEAGFAALTEHVAHGGGAGGGGLLGTQRSLGGGAGWALRYSHAGNPAASDGHTGKTQGQEYGSERDTGHRCS
jgi:hypothetical protein